MSDEFDRAIARARTHVGNAARESVAAIAAILEAGGRASGLDAEQTERLAAEVARRFEAQVERLRDGAVFPDGLARPLEEALAREIERWETRSERDPDARAVLRAFLGLRELLWELGVRGEPSAEPTASPRPPESRPGDPRRVQRFEVED
ncbi:MAG: hypothetical protein CL931_15560 [Deltaproteobacteria bacterium]|nr:hypothetical protein [Deltaproteobacteria bacterium]